jgi:hypothetical protein
MRNAVSPALADLPVGLLLNFHVVQLKDGINQHGQ